jgi:hypothetical protein
MQIHPLCKFWEKRGMNIEASTSPVITKDFECVLMLPIKRTISAPASTNTSLRVLILTQEVTIFFLFTSLLLSVWIWSNHRYSYTFKVQIIQDKLLLISKLIRGLSGPKQFLVLKNWCPIKSHVTYRFM